MEEARKVASVAVDQSEEQKKGQRTVHVATLMDVCHLKNCGVGTEVSEVPRPGRVPR